jgi:hypothetical protein
MKRMQRVLKTFKISEELQETIKSIDQPQTWLVLSEAWCGDAAHSVPAMAIAGRRKSEHQPQNHPTG